MPAQMTQAAWRVGFKNAVLCGVGVVATLGILALTTSTIFGQSFRDSAVIAFGIIMVASFAATGLGWLSAKKRSGSVLLDCGPNPNQRLFLRNAVSFLIMGVIGGPILLLTEFGNLGIATALLCLAGSVFYFFLASSRIQIREHGIWMFNGLLDWHRIHSYHWKDETDSLTLMIQTKTRYQALGKSALPVSIEHKEAIDGLIARYRAVEA